MNLKSLFQDFNPSKFLVYASLLFFTLLLSLRFDNDIKWSYWVVFLPLWIWKTIVTFGASIGSYIWWKHPEYRTEGEGYVHYKAMLISFALHLLLTLFEILVCDKLEADRHLWILVFIPVIFLSIVSIGVCIWAVKHDRSFEMELFCSVNILQFIFIALKLDKFTSWKWVIIFVPLWIVMCLALVGVLYAIIFAVLLLKTPEVSQDQKRASIYSAFAYSFLVIPLLIFLILLSDKLDGGSKMSYLTTCTPLFVSFLTLLGLSFASKGGNKWWFGMRKDFCQFALGICPLLQEYGNISYSLHDNEEDSSTPTSSNNPVDFEKTKERVNSLDNKPIFPALTIESPD